MKKLANLLPLLLIGSCTTSNQNVPRDNAIVDARVVHRMQGPRGKYVPTPEMAVGWRMTKDHREWQPQHLDGDKYGIVLEFILKGDSIEVWKELVVQQITFTKTPLRPYVDSWKALLLKTDPRSKVTETNSGDASVVVDYQSDVANEIGIRKFIKGPDGIYTIAYQVRSASRNEKTFQLWTEIVNGSGLIPNPEKKR